MKKIIMICVLCIVLQGANTAHARLYPDCDVASGPSFAYIKDYKNGRTGYSMNVDTSLSHGQFAASINGKYIRFTDRDRLYGVQSEFTVWLLANLGGGVGYLWGNEKGRVYHVFVGLPILLRENGPAYFLEPYYRCNFFKGNKYHEYGFMIKMTTFHI